MRAIARGVSQVEEDMALLRTVTPRLRTYSALENVDVPTAAAHAGLEVFAGAWVSSDRVATRHEIDAALRQASALAEVTHVVIGNEALLRGDVSVGRMALLLEEARARTDKPVSTAEPWGAWKANPELAQHVDFIAANILPYWDDVPAEQAVDASRHSKL